MTLVETANFVLSATSKLDIFIKLKLISHELSIFSSQESEGLCLRMQKCSIPISDPQKSIGLNFRVKHDPRNAKCSREKQVPIPISDSMIEFERKTCDNNTFKPSTS